MAGLFRRAMDYLYLACVVVGTTALVLISAVIPWAVFTRYVLNSAASWPDREATCGRGCKPTCPIGTPRSSTIGRPTPRFRSPSVPNRNKSGC